VKKFLLIALLSISGNAYANKSFFESISVGSGFMDQWTINRNTAANMTMNCSSCTLDWMFMAESTNAVTDWDCSFNLTGSPTGIQIQGYITTDNGSGYPSTTVLGSSSPAVAAPTSSNMIMGLQNFSPNTGPLVKNTFYHLVISTAGGTAPTSSNYIQMMQLTIQTDASVLHKYDGTNWTDVAAVYAEPACILHFDDGHYEGFISTTGVQNNSVYASGSGVYGSTATGVRFLTPGTGVKYRISGVRLRLSKNGTPPGDFVTELYFGANKVASSTFPVSGLLSGTEQIAVYFDTPTWVDSSTWTYIISRQANGLGSSSNYYSFYVFYAPTVYQSYIYPQSINFVYGYTSNPNALTVNKLIGPFYFMPIIDSWKADISPPPKIYAY